MIDREKLPDWVCGRLGHDGCMAPREGTYVFCRKHRLDHCGLTPAEERAQHMVAALTMLGLAMGTEESRFFRFWHKKERAGYALAKQAISVFRCDLERDIEMCARLMKVYESLIEDGILRRPGFEEG